MKFYLVILSQKAPFIFENIPRTLLDKIAWEAVPFLKGWSVWGSQNRQSPNNSSGKLQLVQFLPNFTTYFLNESTLKKFSWCVRLQILNNFLNSHFQENLRKLFLLTSEKIFNHPASIYQDPVKFGIKLGLLLKTFLQIFHYISRNQQNLFVLKKFKIIFFCIAKERKIHKQKIANEIRTN